MSNAVRKRCTVSASRRVRANLAGQEQADGGEPRRAGGPEGGARTPPTPRQSPARARAARRAPRPQALRCPSSVCPGVFDADGEHRPEDQVVHAAAARDGGGLVRDRAPIGPRGTRPARSRAHDRPHTSPLSGARRGRPRPWRRRRDRSRRSAWAGRLPPAGIGRRDGRDRASRDPARGSARDPRPQRRPRAPARPADPRARRPTAPEPRGDPLAVRDQADDAAGAANALTSVPAAPRPCRDGGRDPGRRRGAHPTPRRAP